MFTTEIDTRRRLATHRTNGGTLQLSDVLWAAQSLFQNPDFGPDMAVIWDLRNCDVGITIQEIISLDSLLVERANAARPSGKTAWVASTSMEESILRLLYSQHDWGTEWQTFSTLDAAIAWCVRDHAG